MYLTLACSFIQREYVARKSMLISALQQRARVVYALACGAALGTDGVGSKLQRVIKSLVAFARSLILLPFTLAQRLARGIAGQRRAVAEDTRSSALSYVWRVRHPFHAAAGRQTQREVTVMEDEVSAT